MQLLIVHHDAEVGEQLAQMVREHTEHRCGFASSDRAALDWARAAASCSLLITQLHGEGVNGLALGGTLSETFAGLQTMFLPDYPATAQRFDVPHPKVFPEPIEGERLLGAIAHADALRQRGLDLFHALDVLQMCCLSGRSGAVQFVRGSQTAIVYLLSGRIVHAQRGIARGADALCEITAWEAIEFAYDYSVRAPAQTIDTAWDEAVIEAVTQRTSQAGGSASAVAERAISSQAPSPAKALRRKLFGGRN